MLLKSVLIAFAVLQLVTATDEPLKAGLDNLKVQYEGLKDCQSNLCGVVYDRKLADSSEFQACQTGCNYKATYGEKCDDSCKQFTGKQFDACKKGCEYKPVDEKKPAVDPVIIPESRPNIMEVVSDLKNEKPSDDKKVDPAVKPEDENNKEGIKDILEKFVKPFFLIHGAPADGPMIEINSNIDDSNIVEFKPIDSKEDDDSDSDSDSKSSEEKVDNGKQQGKPIGDLEEIKLDDSEEPHAGFLSPYQLMNIVNSVYEKAKEKFNGVGSFFYMAKVLENGTVIETFDKPIDDDDDIKPEVEEPPFKIINALMGDHHVSVDDSHNDFENLKPGQHPYWKGRPLPLGKPIVEELDSHGLGFNPRFHGMYRECRPVSFHFSTLCHDLNNFFTCASMRTGLPRWFFLSLILLCSFFMLWLGIFILSMIRRMKRRERTIIYEEDQLPLYKDVVFEEKAPPSYHAEPIPEKVKLETA